MKAKFCCNCGTSLQAEEQAVPHTASLLDAEELAFLNRLAAERDDEDEMDESATASESEEDSEEDQLEDDMKTASKSKRAMREVLYAIENLEKVASNLEETGNIKLAYTVDRVADLLEDYRKANKG